jgi:hypothetical protein
LKVAIYARYSSDNQRDASIADQLRVCREFAARQGWTVVQEFTDHAISGATLLRSGFQVRELNRLRMEHRAGLSSARTELATVEREIRKLVQAIKDGVSALAIKDELLSLEARKAELQSRVEAPEMPELLHPRMSDVYREKVGNLCLVLETRKVARAQGRPSAR